MFINYQYKDDQVYSFLNSFKNSYVGTKLEYKLPVDQLVINMDDDITAKFYIVRSGDFIFSMQINNSMNSISNNAEITENNANNNVIIEIGTRTRSYFTKTLNINDVNEKIEFFKPLILIRPNLIRPNCELMFVKITCNNKYIYYLSNLDVVFGTGFAKKSHREIMATSSDFSLQQIE